MKTKDLKKEVERMGRHVFNQPIIGKNRQPPAQRADIDWRDYHGAYVFEAKLKKACK